MSEHALVLGQEELLEHEADPGGPQGGQLSVGESADVEAGDPNVARAGPVQAAHQVQQGGLARPRRPTMPTSSPWATLKETSRRAVTGGSLG